ncbi:hypothetical protein [Methylocystis echinoides]|uniref:Uncharacterized protein n=1 Tax=Methylocystis echinoides TaxID=29468 RepID=A0A9W6GS37_9HYPH|nr:hypothetical protein [Methylocystis echinoides]GLI92072.1 hypothetical protein LMG27198_10640 [Methylocystis echinoides]
MVKDQTALKQLCSWIMTDIEVDAAPGQDILNFAVARLTEARKQEANILIAEILNGNPSDWELERQWFRNGARIGAVNPAFYRRLFQELKDRLAGKPATFRF